MSQDLATFANNNLLFQTFVTSAEPQLHNLIQVKEKLIEKLKYVNQENYAIPVRETDITKKIQNIQNIKCRKITKDYTLLVRVCKNNCLSGYSQEKQYIKSLVSSFS